MNDSPYSFYTHSIMLDYCVLKNELAYVRMDRKTGSKITSGRPHTVEL